MLFRYSFGTLPRGEFDSRTMEGIGRALAVKPAIAYWDELLYSFLHPRTAGERTGSAVALAAAAKKEKFSELADLVLNDPPIPDALYFLPALVRIDRGRGWPVVEALTGHPEFGRQALVMLRARELRQERSVRKSG